MSAAKLLTLRIREVTYIFLASAAAPGVPNAAIVSDEFNKTGTASTLPLTPGRPAGWVNITSGQHIITVWSASAIFVTWEAHVTDVFDRLDRPATPERHRGDQEVVRERQIQVYARLSSKC
jgi:hypothetical protein